jgi:hypothetical protein
VYTSRWEDQEEGLTRRRSVSDSQCRCLVTLLSSGGTLLIEVVQEGKLSFSSCEPPGKWRDGPLTSGILCGVRRSTNPHSRKRRRGLAMESPYSVGIRRVWDSPGRGCDLFEPPLGPGLIGIILDTYRYRVRTSRGPEGGRRERFR